MASADTKLAKLLIDSNITIQRFFAITQGAARTVMQTQMGHG
jgi:hypothetical protein